ncbi:unnamed protein product [Dracunculus medinensis]|uniref:Glyco_hydro_35 domain-containing protein n=1 Tax=Dracunculus medinensis TaxID=318479 RepID=A0A0N4U489_DRAME|nr:unnamed protein product [Dracunculus medinensis]
MRIAHFKMVSSISNGKKAIQILGKRENRNMAGFKMRQGGTTQYISASIHYFRIHPDYWEDRLKRIRAAGLNAIQTYVPWNFHEPEKGKYLLSGWRNITLFFDIAAQQGLYILLR